MAKSVTKNIRTGTGLVKTNNTISFSPSSSVSMNSNKITDLAAPTTSTDAATKLYVDNAIDTVSSEPQGSSLSKAFVYYMI